MIEENTSESFLDGTKLLFKMLRVVSVTGSLELYKKADRGVLLTFVKLKSVFLHLENLS